MLQALFEFEKLRQQQDGMPKIDDPQIGVLFPGRIADHSDMNVHRNVVRLMSWFAMPSFRLIFSRCLLTVAGDT